MSLRVLNCEYQSDDNLIFRWTYDFAAAPQEAWQIMVKSGNDTIIWDSEWVISPDHHAVYNGRKLDVFETVFWQIRGKDTCGNITPWSKPQKFTSDLLEEEDWQDALWIGAGPENEVQFDLSRMKETDYLNQNAAFKVDSRAPFLRREFELAELPASAFAAFCGLGNGELSVNGHKLGKDILSPPRTVYRKRVLYNVHELTPFLRQGKNLFEIVLGNGWYNPIRKYWGWRMQWHGFPKMRLFSKLTFNDGRSKNIISDLQWQYAFGPEVFNCFYDGCHYDATLEFSRNTSALWQPVHQVPAPGGKLVPCCVEPEIETEALEAVKIYSPVQGIWIADFDKIISGRVKLKLHGQRGCQIKLRFAERVFPDGTLDTRGNSIGLSTDIYTCAGDPDGEEWEPRFAWHGFRYVEISNWQGKNPPDTGNVIAKVIHTACQETGLFNCSDDLINKIHRCSNRSLKLNFHGLPTDCPQRTERLGWLGDAWTTVPAALMHFDVRKFYGKYFDDMADSIWDDGYLPHIVPFALREKPDIPFVSAYYQMLWEYYIHYGDVQIIRRHYPVLCKNMAFWQKQSENFIMPTALWGDHLNREKGFKVAAGKPESISTAMYALCLSLLAKMAELLNLTPEADMYAGEAASVTREFINKYIAADGKVDQDCPIAAGAFALYSMQLPEETANAVLKNILDALAVENRIPTGLLGTVCLIQVLDRYQKFDEIWQLIHRGGDPGYGNMLAGNMSTIPEIWESQMPGQNSRSLTHTPLGAVNVWFYRRLAGIANAPDSAGFRKLEMRPYFPASLAKVDASVETVAGKISSCWRQNNDRILWEISLPAGTQAELIFPENSGMKPLSVTGGQHFFEF